jgi:hypothetical protein
MPQLRVYLGSYRGKANACGFARADGAAKGAFARRAFARFDSGEALYGRKAVLRNPDGTETTLRRSRVEQVRQTKTGREYDRLHIPGKKGPALFAGGFVGEFATFLPKQPRIVTYALDRAYDAISSTLHLDTVAPGLEPIDVRWERIAERVPALPGTQFAGRPVGKFARSDMALWHMFDRLYLHDPAVDAPWVRAHSFAGHARLGMRPYHAHMLVEASSKRVARATYGGHVFAGKSFAISENSDKVKLVYAAIRRSKAARDRILVDTLTLRPRVWGDGVPLDGSVTLGQRVRKRI